MREALSSNHFSHDQQLSDVLNKLKPEEWDELIKVFPELDSDDGISFETTDDGVTLSNWDTEKMGVDIEYTMWVTDWIEEHTEVYWEDGEPWRSDGLDEDDDKEA